MMSPTSEPASSVQLPGWSFSMLPSTRWTLGSADQRGRVDLGCATGHDDPRLRPFAGHAPDRLTCLALGLGGHRAGVDDHRVRRSPSRREPAHHLAFVGVQAATEGDDFDAHGGHSYPSARQAGRGSHPDVSASLRPSARRFPSAGRSPRQTPDLPFPPRSERAVARAAVERTSNWARAWPACGSMIWPTFPSRYAVHGGNLNGRAPG